MSDEPYQVGYGKPPEHTRFKPGQSGNPNGKPKGIKNTKTMLLKLMNQTVTVTENGKRRRITKFELMITQLTNKAIQGDLASFKVLLPLIKNSSEELSDQDQNTETLSSEDQDILINFVKDFRSHDAEDI